MASIFLTSSPSGPLDGSREVHGLDGMNNFTENLRARWKDGSRNLMITAFPSNYAASDEMTSFFRWAVEDAGLSLSAFDLLDDRNWYEFDREKIQSYDCIWLGGGHVPTQNAFFRRLCLSEKIQGFPGIIIGISAGTMNSAATVYSEPEEEGEAVSPDYKRLLPGLGLTEQMILPHYQMVKNNRIDGQRLYEDIVLPDSAKLDLELLNLSDGSYLLCEDGKETVYGEAWMIREGSMEKICETDQTVVLHDRSRKSEGDDIRAAKKLESGLEDPADSRRPGAVVFDMDGVIFDSERLVVECWKAVAPKYGITDLEDLENTLQKCLGVTRERARQIFLEHYGEDFPYYERKKEQSDLFFYRYSNGRLPLKKGVRKLLQALHEQKIPVALASSTRREVVTAQLRDAGIMRFFDAVICGDMVTHSKPHPEIFLTACRELGVDPEQAVAIEDSYNGIRSAHAGHLRPVMVPDRLAPNSEMEELSECILPDLLEVKAYLLDEN